MKPKICMVADVPNWAFDSIAKTIKNKLAWKYDIAVDYFNRRKESDNLYEFIEKYDEYDLIHFLNRRTLLLIDTDVFKRKVIESGKSFEEYISSNKNKISTAVYDYMDITQEKFEEYSKVFNNYVKGYYTCTDKLFDIYSSTNILKKPLSVVHDICDENLFVPINIERFEYDNIRDRKIIIGWVGNSSHSGEREVDLKGFRTIVKPIVKELKQEGYNIEEYYADRNEIWRTSEEMPDYYSKIDLCICASIYEGTPRPVLEAMCSGIPIISTNVGITNEAFGNKQHEYIVGDRENGKTDEEIKKKIKQKIIYLYNNRKLFKELSDENIKSIKEFDGGRTIQSFDNFFQKCLES